MKENSLRNLLGKQYLITAFIEPRIQIVNYIMDGYDNNVPILMNNRFLHFTAHNYYRSIIVDLCALYCDNRASHKYNFYKLLNNFHFETLLQPGTMSLIQTWLANQESAIGIIKVLRDKQIAHYDFEQESIDLDFDNLKIITDLFDLAKRVIVRCGSSFIDEEQTIGYDFGRRSYYVTSLERLINNASRNK